MLETRAGIGALPPWPLASDTHQEAVSPSCGANRLRGHPFWVQGPVPPQCGADRFLTLSVPQFTYRTPTVCQYLECRIIQPPGASRGEPALPLTLSLQMNKLSRSSGVKPGLSSRSGQHGLRHVRLQGGDTSGLLWDAERPGLSSRSSSLAAPISISLRLREGK